MQFEATTQDIKQASIPHNLMILMLFLFNLLAVPALLALHFGMLGLLIPLICSSAFIGFVFLRSQKISSHFIAAHWRLAFKHGKWLLLGYTISAALILVAWLVSLSAQEESMRAILWTALTRIALLPTLIAVMIVAVMEASALSLAVKCEAPER